MKEKPVLWSKSYFGVSLLLVGKPFKDGGGPPVQPGGQPAAVRPANTNYEVLKAVAA